MSLASLLPTVLTEVKGKDKGKKEKKAKKEKKSKKRKAEDDDNASNDSLERALESRRLQREAAEEDTSVPLDGLAALLPAPKQVKASAGFLPDEGDRQHAPELAATTKPKRRKIARTPSPEHPVNSLLAIGYSDSDSDDGPQPSAVVEEKVEDVQEEASPVEAVVEVGVGEGGDAVGGEVDAGGVVSDAAVSVAAERETPAFAPQPRPAVVQRAFQVAEDPEEEQPTTRRVIRKTEFSFKTRKPKEEVAAPTEVC